MHKARIFTIAGVTIKLVANQFENYDSLAAFSASSSSAVTLEIVLEAQRRIAKPKGPLLINTEVKWANIAENIYTSSIYYCEGSGEVLCRADVNSDWSKGIITYLQNNSEAEKMAAGFLLEIIFRNRIIFEQGLVIHAAAISHEGQGIIFTAPSGTGKSTQAKLWADYKGARTLNDDRPVLRLADNRTWVMGTPWSEKQKLFTNGGSPLRAIVVLEQGQENKIECMPVSNAGAYILPRCFLPYFNSEMMAVCLSTLGKMLVEVPVYRLVCKPDRNAVEMLFDSIKLNKYPVMREKGIKNPIIFS